MEIKDKVKKAIKGDDEAFEYIINSCKEKLYRTAFAYVKNEEQALDIVQETVYKAYISIGKLKNPEYFNIWITRILINNALTIIKKNSKVVYLDNDELINSVIANEVNSDEKIYIWQALEELELKHREVIVLKYFDDLTVTEIAGVLGYPVGTVKTYLNKGLKKLREFVGKDVV
ncbi:sigma-70 family RNA polymerase sigma factor [Clostridium massiliamazoniense]|uniref:sigma-70 family RNA polymerase sigma factor n=1 Tax=Clostridium massiliamazoniense TaxID=1347366 RepID=UPI0006D78970|nr:sigma-70 family RNA polymerase sigma factor [Clostridium massiliamazoniense]